MVKNKRQLYLNSFFLVSGATILLSTILLTSLNFLYEPEILVSVDIYKYLGTQAGFLYFTNQTNLLFGFALLLYGFSKKNWVALFLFASIIWITITLTIFWLFISWNISWINTLGNFKSILNHLIYPAFAISLMPLLKSKLLITRKHRFLVPLYTFLYYFFHIILFYVTIPIVSRISNDPNNVKGVLIYIFASPIKPFFIETSSIFFRFILLFAMSLSAYSYAFLLELFFIRIWRLRHIVMLVKSNHKIAHLSYYRFASKHETIVKYSSLDRIVQSVIKKNN